MISGYIEFNLNDTELIETIFGDKITDIYKSDFPGFHVARLENTPDAVLDELAPYWEQFEWTVDE